MLDSKNNIQIATKEDVYKIYQFAKGRYEESRINGPTIKLSWWQINPHIFYVVHDKDRNVCANINLLPLKKECYENLKEGYINEKEIQPKDIYTLSQKKVVKHIYVEGFNCEYKYDVYNIIINLEKMLENLIDVRENNILIGAIGGTKEGENIMHKLGFEVKSTNSNLLGKNFLEIDYNTLIKYIDSIKKINY